MQETQICKRSQWDRRQSWTFPGIRMAAIQTAISRSGGVRQPTVRTGVIDRGGQLVRQHLGELVDRNVEARRELPDGVAAKHLLQLFGRDRQVLAVADP